MVLDFSKWLDYHRDLGIRALSMDDDQPKDLMKCARAYLGDERVIGAEVSRQSVLFHSFMDNREFAERVRCLFLHGQTRLLQLSTLEAVSYANPN